MGVLVLEAEWWWSQDSGPGSLHSVSLPETALLILVMSMGPGAEHPSPRGFCLSMQSCVTQSHSLDLSVPQSTRKMERIAFVPWFLLLHRI